MDANCETCGANIPDHFLKRGIAQCPTCEAIKHTFSEDIKPQNKTKIHITNCKLCGGEISSEFNHPLCEPCMTLLTEETGMNEKTFFASAARPWLVRCDGRIFGPLSSEEVISKLRSKEVGLFDQIVTPFEQWRYVREENTFKQVLEEMKIQGGEDTASTETAFLENTVVTEAVPVADLLEPALSSPAKHETHRRLSPKIWIFFGVAIAGMLVFFFRPTWPPSFQRSTREFGEYLRDAKQAQVIGDFDKAILNYKEAFAIRDDDADVAFNLASLYIDTQQTVQASRIIEKFSGRQAFEKFYVEFHVLMGLIALVSENPEKAEDELKKALEANKQSMVAILNLASAHSMKGDYQKSYDLLTSQFDENESHPLGLLLLAESVINEDKLSKDPKIVSSVLDKFNNFSQRSSEYFQEIGVARILLNLKLEKKDRVKDLIEDVLDADPDESAFHLQDPLIFRDHIKWGHILTWCREINQTLGDKVFSSAFLGVCTLKSGDALTGKNLIENSLKKSEENSLIQALYSYAEGLLGLTELSDAALKAAQSENGAKTLPVLLGARKCAEKKDAVCATSGWKKMLELNPKSLAALAGLAQLALDQKQFPEAHEYIQKGFQISTNYQPLLKLQIEYEKLKK